MYEEEEEYKMNCKTKEFKLYAILYERIHYLTNTEALDGYAQFITKVFKNRLTLMHYETLMETIKGMIQDIEEKENKVI